MTLPVGISFYTFQTLSYVIDVYRGETKVQRNLISFGCYVTMFPQLIAGPIVQYKDIDDQLKNRRLSVSQTGEGAVQFIRGLTKKVILQIISARYLPRLRRRISRICPCFLHGWPVLHIPSRFISISEDTAIWPSASGRCWASNLNRTSIILISLRVLPSSGEGGIFLWGPGSGIISTYRWAEVT